MTIQCVQLLITVRKDIEHHNPSIRVCPPLSVLEFGIFLNSCKVGVILTCNGDVQS